MRFMMLMIPQVYQNSNGKDPGPDFAPPADAVAKMSRYNESLVKAGALITLDGLKPPSQGVRVSFRGGKPKVTDGPFTESKEVLGGYWMINVRSKEEAVEWARKVPANDGDVVELRQVQEWDEFPEDVRKAGANPTVSEHLKKHRA